MVSLAALHGLRPSLARSLAEPWSFPLGGAGLIAQFG